MFASKRQIKSWKCILDDTRRWAWGLDWRKPFLHLQEGQGYHAKLHDWHTRCYMYAHCQAALRILFSYSDSSVQFFPWILLAPYLWTDLPGQWPAEFMLSNQITPVKAQLNAWCHINTVYLSQVSLEKSVVSLFFVILSRENLWLLLSFDQNTYPREASILFRLAAFLK